MKSISQEAISFQSASAPTAMANELTAIFQDVIDYRNTQVDSGSERIANVMNYFIGTAAPKVLTTIEKGTGLKMNMSVPKTLVANFAILIDFDDDGDADQIIRRYSGLLNDKSYRAYIKQQAKICKTQEELEQFSNSLNKETGFIEAAVMKKHKFKCKLFFDVYAAFLIKEVGGQACDPLTAPEITAVLLHEIGHAVSFIEHAADVVAKKEVIEATTREFFTNAPDEEKLNYISSVITPIVPEGGTALKGIYDYIETNKKRKGSLIWSGIRILMSSIGTLILCLGLGLCKFIANTVLLMSDTTIGGAVKSLRSISKVKSSDFYKLSKDNQYCEMLADQYVTRFGYGGHFATQLQKIYDWSRITGLGDMKMKQLNSAAFYGRLLPWVIYTAFYGDQISRDYMTESKRYEYLLQETLKVFKDNSVSEDLLSDYYKSYELIKRVLDNPSWKRRYAMLCGYLHSALKYIVSTPAELIFTGRFDREYERLYNQVQSLMNNELYAAAYKLKNM